MPHVGAVSRFFKVLLLSIVLLAPAAVAQDIGAESEPSPLGLADTSSPRETLRSFLTNANENVRLLIENGSSEERYPRLLAAIDALDFSTIAGGGSWNRRHERVLLLRAILGRLDLPAFEEIPGDEEVARDGIDSWTVPGTRITIELQESGPRKGEFLFSSASVARLGVVYRRIRDLPGADTFYEDRLAAQQRTTGQAAAVRNRFKGLDTSSPRSTLNRFLESVNWAYRLIMDTESALRESPPAMTVEEAKANQLAAYNLLMRASEGLDFSQVPKAQQETARIENVILLKEILDRVVLPPIEAVPDADSLARASRDTPHRWQLPDTELEIIEIVEGDREGAFLFSAETVARLPGYYDRLEDLPYYVEVLPTDKYEYASPGTSDGFYEFYRRTPGWLVPSLTLVGPLVSGLPDWLQTIYGGQTIWQWIALILFVAGIAVAAGIVFRVVFGLARQLTLPWDGWLRILPPSLVAVMVVGAMEFIDEGIGITGGTLAAAILAGTTIVTLMVAWVSYGICLSVARTAIVFLPFERQSSEAGLVRIIANVVGFLIAAVVIVEGLQDLGADLVPLLAGLGIGGLAVALAIRPTLENVFGGFVLFANKPVRPGDFCRYGDQIGTVEYVGWISTRIRSLERTIVTVPNGEFSRMKLDNITARDERLLRTTLQLRYETTPEQLRNVLANLRRLLLGHPKVTPEPARVRFVGLGAYSLDVEIFAYLRCQDQSTFLAIQEDILLRIVDIVKQAGTGFAFPSQTAYLARDGGLDAERSGAAEAEVDAWRSKGELPFPDFGDVERGRLEDSLDYPPKGSPHYDPSAGRLDPQEQQSAAKPDDRTAPK